MEKIIRRISFSEYSTYQNCQHKWYLTYGLKYPGEVSEELLFGSAIHNTIENILTNQHISRLYKMDKEGTIKSVFRGFLQDELIKIKDELFLAKFRDQNLASIFMWQAIKTISALDFNNRFSEYEISDVEVKLDGVIIYETEEVAISFKGFVDLVLKNKKTIRRLILDWKTSRKAWDISKKMKDNEDFFAQLCLYKKFYSEIKEVDFGLIDTKFYNLPREEPEKQSAYVGILRKEYVELFFSKFVAIAVKIFEHSKTLENFSKAKHVTKKNFCYRCPFNKQETCNDHEEFQKVGPPILPPIEEVK